MRQSLYPEAIPSSETLRCHDAFISRYDAGGMNSLEVHQDTTDFTFTIGLNPASDFEGGGTAFWRQQQQQQQQQDWLPSD